VHNALALFYLRKIKRLTTPGRIIEFSLKRYCDKTFLIQPDKNLQITFKEFGERVMKATEDLRQKGLGRGDVLAFCAQNCVEYFELRAACHLTGVVFMGLPASLAQEDIEYFLKKTNAKAINKGTGPLVGTGPPVGTGPLGGTGPFATFNLSSGTTGRTPKIVQITDENWTESLYNYVRNSDIRPGKKIVFMSTLPLVTAGSTTFLPALLAGLTYIVIKEDSPVEAIAGYIRNYKVTRLYITPSRLMELLEWCKQNNRRLAGLENIVTGTEGFPATRLKEAAEFFGPIITRGYGMVEVLPPISLLSVNGYRKLDSVGKVLKGVQVGTLDDDRIVIKSKTVSKGYLDNPEENAAHFKNGWFITNDYGRIDEDGFLYVRGRQEEIVAREPKLVFANEVEEAIYALPFVRQCAAIPDSPVRIFVSLREPVSPEEVRTKILNTLRDSPLRTEADIIIRESLPINPLGKLDRRLLAQS
jgi:acyl-CoA synthetase (AMP-forming)/AMP-acid ligase II